MFTRTTLFLGSVVLLLALPALLNFPGHKPTVSTITTAGYSEVNVQVGENGESKVNLPIAVPKGTLLAPEISIGYSSQAGNGLLGQGFQLEGLYTISRAPANKAQDGYTDGVDFDGNDRFSFNGERLIKISSGAYGGDGTEYRTEQNNFSRFIAYGTSGSGPQRFRVWTKSGLIMDFGNTAASRIEAQGRAEILVWLVNRITDTKGNYIDFSYIEETAKGEFRIDKIQYTGNSAAGLLPYNTIQFSYESRPDSNTAFMAGSKIGLSKRLYEILVSDNGTQYRKYTLSYAQMGNKKVSHIKEIEECGIGGTQCFTPTKFNWTIENVFGTVENPFATNLYEGFYDTDADLRMDGRIRPADVTGDGKMDLVLGPTSATGDWYVLTSTGKAFTPATWKTGTGSSGDHDPNRYKLMDVNADGLMDVVWTDNPHTGYWKVMKSTGTAFENPIVWYAGGSDTDISADRIWVMDADGDGRQDIVLGPNPAGQWFVFTNTGSAFTRSIWATGAYGSSDGDWNHKVGRIHPLDLNGDGLTDFVFGPADNGNWYWLRNTGSSFIREPNALITNAYGNWNGKLARIHQTDLNGDGLVDFLLGPEEGTGNWYALRNTGLALENVGAYVTGLYANWATKESRIRQMDLNGDGINDFLFGPEELTGNWYCMYNTGKGFELGYDGGYWLYGFYANWSDNDHTRFTRPTDVNGDGVTDLCFGPENVTGNWYVITNQLSVNSPHLLQSVTNGHGATTEFSYEKLTNPNTYEKGSGAVFPKMNFIGPLFVVRELRTDDGIGGQNKINYKYYDVKLDLEGRGFRGFAKTEIIDSLRGTKNTVFYERTHQFISTKINGTETRLLANNKLIYEAQNTLDTFEYFNKTVHFSFLTNTLEKWYDLPSASAYKTKNTAFSYDNWGNATLIVENTNNGLYTVQTQSTYSQDTTAGKWLLGRLTEATVTKTLQNQPVKIKRSTFAYDPLSGMLVKEVLNSLSSSLKLQTDYTLDIFGNRLTATVSGPGITTRTTTNTYDAQGRDLLKATNPLGQEVNFTYEYGLLKSTTDPNGLTETINRDGFGRETALFHADETTTNISYEACTGPDCPEGAIYYLERTVQGGAKTRTYLDRLDREVRVLSYGLDGQQFKVDTRYDSSGRVAAKSDPYRDTPLWNLFRYDGLQRMISQTALGNRRDSIVYNGLTTTTINPLNQASTRIMNAIGWLSQAKDQQNNIIQYGYDSDGNTISMTDPVGNSWNMQYDSRGNKILLNDPDLGMMHYSYNTLGLLTEQEYPNGDLIAVTYDLLDRPVTQTEPERSLIYEYDTQPMGIGKPARTKIDGLVSDEYTYDPYGRLKTGKEVIEGQAYTITYGYDADSRLLSLTYPGTAFKLRYAYDAYGNLKKVQNYTTNYTYWQVDSLNNRGQTTQMTLGNGLHTRMGYDGQTGFLQNISTGTTVNPLYIQNLSFAYSAIGNLTQRADGKVNQTENFSYDNLNRLTQSQVVGQTAVNITYNALGNILSKSNVGTYTYGTNGAVPHMVTSIDHAGVANCFYGFQGSVAYTSYQYPRLIVDQQDSIAFTYDSGRRKQTQRLVKNGTLIWKKHYINDMMERVTQGSYQKYVCFIKAGNETIATLTRPVSGGADTLRYLHKDHLGSVQAISREDGLPSTTFSYDAWGMARDPITWQPYLTPTPLPPFERGFTFHEMLGIEDLVHMNARLYDPAIGRMLSPDPIIQAPDNLQSLNRASYVINNPLSLTDPTGFSWLSQAFHALAPIIVGAALALFAPIALGALGATFTSGFINSVVSGISFGFGSSFTSTLISGGSLGDAFRNGLQGGIMGGVSAGLAYGVGSVFGDVSQEFSVKGITHEIGRAVAHGVTQGGIRELTGGNFRSGFFSGLGSSLTGSYVSENINSMLGRAAAGAIIGGSFSKLSGGNFANGAITGAFVQLFNHELHKKIMNSIKQADDLNDVSEFITINGEKFIKGPGGTLLKVAGTGISMYQNREYIKNGYTAFQQGDIITGGINGMSVAASTFPFVSADVVYSKLWEARNNLYVQWINLKNVFSPLIK